MQRERKSICQLIDSNCNGFELVEKPILMPIVSSQTIGWLWFYEERGFERRCTNPCKTPGVIKFLKWPFLLTVWGKLSFKASKWRFQTPVNSLNEQEWLVTGFDSVCHCSLSVAFAFTWQVTPFLDWTVQRHFSSSFVCVYACLP